MPFSTYAELQSTVLDWLGRPDDPLLAPAVPDFVRLAEAEMRDRLQARFAEQLGVELYNDGAGVFFLPCDFAALRRVTFDTRGLRYRAPFEFDDVTQVQGRPLYYSIEGLTLRVSPPPDQDLPAVIDYIQGLPALSERIATNWCLEQYPDLYLYASLAAAEGYIGNDERVAGWLQQREQAFERIRRANIVAAAGGAPLRVIPIGATP